ncbi:type II toxin-antitoxin system Phd/YefM family antitoxin [Verminephrobacter eiseniae]|uniref:type II toxin-antitoxin system Phd/YefM family antitoxin n=1 Tax=Verminephrobacter eiseniae TaxID=364317 RepID=UPI0022388B3D|nr:hypothetical protein [Verminephrobacter eiseniae]MCW5237382.1 hypothetical protein [Verminephrobacter eiseniae]
MNRPIAVIRDAGTGTIVVLHRNKPSAYLVPASTYEALMDVLDDLQLIPVVAQRISSWQADPDDVIEVTREELAQIARGAPAKSSRSRASARPLGQRTLSDGQRTK